MRQQPFDQASQLHERSPKHLQRAKELSSEKGVSFCLSALPIEYHAFTVHKSAIRDALCLHYNWQSSHLPSKCTCGLSFSVDHTLNRPTGGMPTIRHNEVRDFTGKVITVVCHDVCLKLSLQPLKGERFHHITAITKDGARLDIRAQSFEVNGTSEHSLM